MSGPDGDDRVVRAALQLLPVPEHRPGFWDDVHLALEVEAALHPVAAAVPALTPPPVAAPTLVPAALRRRSNAVLATVAVAAAVVVALAGQSLLANRTGTTARRSSASAELEALVDRSQPQRSTPDPLSAAEQRSASDAVVAWVGSIVDGEAADAWEGLGPSSQAHFGTAAAFAAEMDALADAYAPWSADPPSAVVVTPVRVDEAGTLAVVTLTTATAAEAVPVRIRDGAVEVEPVASMTGLELVTPSAAVDADVAEALPRGQEILIVVPVGADAPLLRIDDGDLVVCGETDGSELTTLDDGSAQRCAYLPPADQRSGRHTLTVAFGASDSDSLIARSVLFDAA